MTDTVIVALSYLCWITALGSVVAYVYSFMKHRPYSRLWNAAGLFLTGAALFALPAILSVSEEAQLPYAVFVVALLIGSAAFQAATALRRRKRAEG